jgi:hypothetical protein
MDRWHQSAYCSTVSGLLFYLNNTHWLFEMLTTTGFSLPNCGFVGLEILAFPCNQFGGQEPGTNEEIVQFACTRFKAEYPIFDKVDLGSYLFSSTKVMHISVQCETNSDLVEHDNLSQCDILSSVSAFNGMVHNLHFMDI